MTALAIITLTTPMMLWGLGLLSLPFVAHLLNRQVQRRIIFPTIRLLRESAATQSRLFRLRRWILLLLRCLAVAMIAWAFARPVWTGADDPNPASGTSAGVMVLVDASASVSQEENGISMLGAIRTAADRTLDSLKSGTDVADIVIARARPEAVFARLSPNLPALRAAISELKPTEERADLSGALALAGRILAEHTGPRRLVILSDLQQTNWSDVLDQKSINQLLPAQTDIMIVRVNDAPPGNIGLSLPHTYPAQPMTGHPMQVSVQVGNLGEQPAQARLDMTRDGQPAGSQTVMLGPREQREVSFDATITTPGQHRITFAIPADGLAVDNHAYLVLNAAEHAPVTLIADDAASEAGSSSFYITRALAPHGDKSDPLEVKRIGSAEVTSASLQGAGAVLIGDIGVLKPEAAAAIIEFARAGGGVVMFCGDGPVDDNVRILDHLGGEVGIAPFLPSSRRDLSASGNAVAIASGAWQSHLLKAYDERSQLALAQISFRRVFLANQIRPDAKVLLSFGDGSPALATRQVGLGQIVLANFSPALRSSDLGRYGAFVALMQSMVDELQPRPDPHNAPMAGVPFDFAAIDAIPGQLSVLDPSGNTTSASNQTDEKSKRIVSVAQPVTTGFYQLQRDGQTVLTAAVNLDPRESDLRRVDEAALTRQLNLGGSNAEISALNQGGPIVRLRGRPLWDWFLAAALIALAAELLILGFLRR